MMSSHALTSASAEKSSSRILSAKPEWDKLQARFLQSLRIEKEREGISAKPTDHIASSLSFQHLGYQKVTEEGGKIFSFGSDLTGSPDNYVCRQRYLRSYVFTRDEEGSKSVVEKFKRLFKHKKKGKSGNANSCSFSDTCLKFLCCIVKADGQT
ncbi:hypothetical protein SADUNF_Sadunf07G0029600 [Salix dunnii]|uniref:Uncharacterized protein n=1 Tax=Salix dunnii TaxID=1413687 RepID=A0A835K2R8_9ROSI|nr:hypothetical protein SADUNF_Sadunf07G0029600 [Salix dunnii]